MKICKVCGKAESGCECIPEILTISERQDPFDEWAHGQQSLGGVPWGEAFTDSQLECWRAACRYAVEACARICDYRAASMHPIVPAAWDEAVYLARIIRGGA